MVRVPVKINFVGSSLNRVRTYSVGTFFCTVLDLRKPRERELATFDENRRAVGTLNPMRDK